MKRILISILSIFLISCELKSSGTFYISNNSQDHSEIPLVLIVDNDTVFNESAKYSDIRPDTQYIQRIKLVPGEHEITFKVANSDLKKTEIIDFTKDKWIFLSYSYRAPADSLKRLEFDKRLGNLPKTDSIFASFYNGTKPSMSLYIMENEPILE